jgi:hypothetical protein
MSTIFAANESQVLVDGQAIEGVRAIEYRKVQSRENVFGLGSAERIGMVSGPQVLEGRIRVTSTAASLDALTVDQQFQVSAVLRHGETNMTVTFDECYLLEKTFEMGVGGQGEAVYSFTATRVREEMGSSA